MEAYYCESCKREGAGEVDEYGVKVCIDCRSDLVIGMHVGGEYIVAPAELEGNLEYAGDFDAFLQRD